MTVFENILFGAVASIIASLILALVSQIYKLGAKRRIDYCIENALLAFHSFENAVEYNFYDLAIAQVDVVIDELNNINQNICYLTYFPTKKKLFYTFMNNVFRFMSVVKNVNIGYSGEAEKQARCERIRHHLDAVSVDSKSWICLNLEIMRNLNCTKPIRKALKKGFTDMTNDECVSFYEKLVEVNSFDTGLYTNKYVLKAKGYSKEKFIEKIYGIIKHGGKQK